MLKVEFLFLLVWFLHGALGTSSFNINQECFFIGLFFLLFLDCLVLNLLDFLQILSHKILFWRQWFRNLCLILFLRLIKPLIRGKSYMIQLSSDQLHLSRLFNRFLNYAVFPSFIDKLFSGTFCQFVGLFKFNFLFRYIKLGMWWSSLMWRLQSLDWRRNGYGRIHTF